jgi:peptidoglycan/xylan/chitin deacetylase (PgdA/CDA1 family)
MLGLSSLLAASSVGVVPLGYFSPWTWRIAQAQWRRKQLAKERVLALTYDDGPSAKLTPTLLDLLASFDVRASFFMLGGHARSHPRIVDRVLAEGHDVGCHGDRHLNAWTVAPWRAIADIRAGYRKMVSWVPPDGMFRPPHGKITLATWAYLGIRGAPVWWWTVDSGDTRGILPQSKDVVERVVREGGGIVLMHDLEASTTHSKFVIETSGLLLEAADREGIDVKPLREL